MKTNIFLRPAIVTLVLLLIPVIGMRVSDGWQWTLFDFIFMGVLIFGTGLLLEYAIKKAARNKFYKIAAGIGLVVMFLLVWVNAAVGIISEDEWPNLLYLALPLIGLSGALLSRFQSRGLSRTMFSLATWQLLIPIIVFFADRSLMEQEPGIAGVFAINFIFALLFAVSGLLFQKAAREIKPPVA